MFMLLFMYLCIYMVLVWSKSIQHILKHGRMIVLLLSIVNTYITIYVYFMLPVDKLTSWLQNFKNTYDDIFDTYMIEKLTQMTQIDKEIDTQIDTKIWALIKIVKALLMM